MNQRGTRMFVIASTYTWLSSCHIVLAQWKSPGLRPPGESIATTLSERHAQRAQSRHAHGADGEIFMIRINFHLHRLGQLELVFLFVGRHGALQLRLEIRPQQLRFLLLQPQNGGAES